MAEAALGPVLAAYLFVAADHEVNAVE